MDVEELVEFTERLIAYLMRLVSHVRAANDDSGQIYYLRFQRVMHLILPFVPVLLIYYYLKYLLIFDAHKYEEYLKKRYGRLRKLSRQLKLLSKRCGSSYYYYMPMSHGITLPRPYTLFVAIKEVLVNSNRPATRGLRWNLLQNLLHVQHSDNQEKPNQMNFPDPLVREDLDPLSEFNLDIMKSCRELIIQGVKDFDVMSTVYRVMETVMEDSE